MKVVWTPRARADLLDIYSYLAERSPKGAQRTLLRILERVAGQAFTPFAAPVERAGPERCLVVTRTPYIVLYNVSGGELNVVAVYHGFQQRG